MPSNPASLANCRHSRRFIRSGYGNAHWLIDFFMPYRLGEALRESFAGWAAAEVVPAAARPPTPMASLKAERRDNSLPAGAGVPHGAVSFGVGSFCDGMVLNCVRARGKILQRRPPGSKGNHASPAAWPSGLGSWPGKTFAMSASGGHIGAGSRSADTGTGANPRRRGLRNLRFPRLRRCRQLTGIIPG